MRKKKGGKPMFGLFLASSSLPPDVFCCDRKVLSSSLGCPYKQDFTLPIHSRTAGYSRAIETHGRQSVRNPSEPKSREPGFLNACLGSTERGACRGVGKAKGWQRVGKGIAQGWRRVGKGLAGFLAPSTTAIPEAPI